MPKVFVYGSLRKELHNDYLLENSTLLGLSKTHPEWTLFDLGAFPAAVPSGSTAILGEVYEVDKRTLNELDQLEMCPTWYQRKLIDTDYGAAWIFYLQAVDSDCAEVKAGDWKSYIGNRASVQDLDWLISERFENEDDTSLFLGGLGFGNQNDPDDY